MATDVLCPPLAEQHDIITKDNIHSLSLNNYERTPGSLVMVTCLSKNTHKVIGQTIVKCLDNGQWDSVPECVPVTGGTIVGTTTASTGTDVTKYSDYDMMPYFLAIGILGIAVVLFIILVSYALYRHRRSKTEKSGSIYEGTRSSVPSQSDLWMELANPRHFRCHELAQSRDISIDSVLYKQPYRHWSSRY